MKNVKLNDKEKKKIYDVVCSDDRVEVGKEIASETVMHVLRNNGIDYKKYGFVKAIDMIKDMQEYFELRYVSFGEFNANPRITVRETMMSKDDISNIENISNLQNIDEENLDDYKKAIYDILLQRYEIGNEYAFADVSLYLLYNGFPKERFGFKKMRDMLEAMPEFIEMKWIDRNGCPQALVTLHESIVKLEEKSDNGQINAQTVSWLNAADDIRIKKLNIENFADMSEEIWMSLLQDLVEEADDEEWCKSADKDENPYRILKSYIKYTFQRLSAEEKVIIKDNKNDDVKLAVFNSGLATSQYDDIFVVFTKDGESSAEKWKYEGVCTEGVGKLGKKVISNINFKDDYPRRAQYLVEVKDILFDTSRYLSWDNDHVIIDRIHRIPKDYLINVFGQYGLDDVVKNLESESVDWDSIRDGLRKKDRVYSTIKDNIDTAINKAKKKIELNYKTAIPCYYPTINQMSWLIPLCLSCTSKKADVVLIVSYNEKSGNYQGQTIINLDMAYTDARLICRPNSDWLTIDM